MIFCEKCKLCFLVYNMREERYKYHCEKNKDYGTICEYFLERKPKRKYVKRKNITEKI